MEYCNFIDIIFRTIPVLFWILSFFVFLGLIYESLVVGFDKGFMKGKIIWFDNWSSIYVLIFSILGCLVTVFKFLDNNYFMKYIEFINICFNIIN